MDAQGMLPDEPRVHAENASYAKDPPLVVPLTNREMEILHLLADGLSNMEIANHFGLAEATVKSHLVHLYKKLGSKRRTQAIAWARACKLLD
ncbi:response regulator transcription factor [Paenibacillus periandrae]|uniref:response regulator transcription factor n=1 Tax=Paenibacillus periandrae TaxID=1761741 RepID=UPI001F095D4A|nr:LuxR C-terminal-related transcriptional regulator [Paenibacillus periandrae]